MVYDTAALRRSADILTVAECIGMECQVRNGRPWFICPNPNHHDKHFGSCYGGTDRTTGDGFFTCRACGEHGDVLKMVQLFLGCSFEQACKTVGDTCGGAELYLMDKKDIRKKAAQAAEVKTLPDRDVLRLIGLEPGPIYETVGFLSDCEPEELGTGQFAEWLIGPDEKDDIKVVKQRVAANGILWLKQNDPEAYESLLKDKCLEATEKYRTLKDQFIAPKIELASQLVDTAGKDVLIGACDGAISRIEDLMIELGLTVKKPEKAKLFTGIKVVI